MPKLSAAEAEDPKAPGKDMGGDAAAGQTTNSTQAATTPRLHLQLADRWRTGSPRTGGGCYWRSLP